MALGFSITRGVPRVTLQELGIPPSPCWEFSIPPAPPVHSLFLYLVSLGVFQPLGTVHIQEEVLQQRLCLLEVPGVLSLELEGFVLLLIADILETRKKQRRKKI